jgi:hypothetical protein
MLEAPNAKIKTNGYLLFVNGYLKHGCLSKITMAIAAGPSQVLLAMIQSLAYAIT